MMHCPMVLQYVKTRSETTVPYNLIFLLEFWISFIPFSISRSSNSLMRVFRTGSKTDDFDDDVQDDIEAEDDAASVIRFVLVT